jgi:hypothetical protein
MRNTTVGDWLPIVKFDARSGRLFRMDKNESGQSVPTEIPYGTTFGVDFGTLEAGYVYFSLTQGPMRQMTPYYEGATIPPQPTERDDQNRILYRSGFYIKIIGNAFMTDDRGNGAVREWVSNASSLLNAMDDLYNRYRIAPEAAQDQIPIVAITGVNTIRTGSGQRATTNYAPIFEIRGWAPRPIPMLGPRTTPIPGQEPRGNGHATPHTPLPPTPPVAAPPPSPAVPPNWLGPTQQPPAQQPPATAQPRQAAIPPDALPF